VVRTAAWTVPAVSLVSAAPAFAASPTMDCQTLVLTPVLNWTSNNGNLTRHRKTGWWNWDNPPATPGANGYIAASEAVWYENLDIPGHAFLSFEDNPTTNTSSGANAPGTATVTVQYAVTVTGHVTLNVAGGLWFGYGHETGGATERQMVDVDVIGLAGGTRRIASLAPRRQGGQGVFYPTAAMLGGNSSRAVTSTNNGRLKEQDSSLTQRYALSTPPTQMSDGRFKVDFAGTPVVDDVEGDRTLFIQYTLTMPARYGSSWVNDDVIILPPTVTVNC
jgi:hypothetical protein